MKRNIFIAGCVILAVGIIAIVVGATMYFGYNDCVYGYHPSYVCSEDPSIQLTGNIVATLGVVVTIVGAILFLIGAIKKPMDVLVAPKWQQQQQQQQVVVIGAGAAAQAPAGASYCSSCGVPIKRNAKYCNVCGAEQ